MFNFIIQGYPFTALLLFFLYCFHEQARSYYYTVARTANILLWLYLIGVVGTIIYAQIFIQNLLGFSLVSGVGRFFANELPTYAVLPYLIVFIALLFKKVRKHAVWILIPLAFLVRPTMLSGDFLGTGAYTIVLLNSLIFLLVSITVTFMVTNAKESITKENNRLPDRI